MASQTIELNPISRPEDAKHNVGSEDKDSMLISKALYEETHTDITWSQIIGGSVGNILEWYDFGTFGMLASEIGSNFFPSGSNNHGIELLKAYGVFAGAFIMRPVGGVIFGVIGDKMGRKRALQISMIMMFTATFIMGCLPTVHSIGIWAPILLTLLRLFQGISVGGQLVGSILFIVESARPQRRGFYGGLTMMTAVVGGTMASFVVALLNMIYTEDQMTRFGWRLPFLSSLIVAVLGVISQSRMEGSVEFQNATSTGTAVKNPIKEALRQYWKRIVLISLAVVTWCGGGYLTFTFLPVYLEKEVGVDHSILVSTLMTFWNMICLLIGGHLADKYGYVSVMKLGSGLQCVCSIPCYYLIYRVNVVSGANHILPLFITDLVAAMNLGLFGGPMQVFMVNVIDDVVLRYSAIGAAYNLTQAVLGGTAPLIGTSLALLNFCYVGVYYTILCGISWMVLHFMHRNDIVYQQANDSSSSSDFDSTSSVNTP